jgi:hypothetical protein
MHPRGVTLGGHGGSAGAGGAARAAVRDGRARAPGRPHRGLRRCRPNASRIFCPLYISPRPAPPLAPALGRAAPSDDARRRAPRAGFGAAPPPLVLVPRPPAVARWAHVTVCPPARPPRPAPPAPPRPAALRRLGAPRVAPGWRQRPRNPWSPCFGALGALGDFARRGAGHVRRGAARGDGPVPPPTSLPPPLPPPPLLRALKPQRARPHCSLWDCNAALHCKAAPHCKVAPLAAAAGT